MLVRSFPMALFALISAFGASAQACPNLTGHYTCTYDGQFGHKVFELDGKTNKDKNGATIYVVNGKEVYTDGQKHHTDSLPILDQWADDVNYTGTCNGENRIHIVGDARVKRYNMRADLDGDLIKRNEKDLTAAFRVKMGFFGTDIEVPCVKK